MQEKDRLSGGRHQSFIEIRESGLLYRVQIAQTMEELKEVKALDDLAFGSHLGITMEELVEIQEHGRVLLLHNAAGQLLGESQVITEGISQHLHVAQDEAYNYGTAIRPDIQSSGIAQVLFKAQEVVAREAGKTRSTLTVRLENAQSIRGRLKAGFKIVGYSREEYGPFEDGGARLIMEKKLRGKASNFDPKRQANDLMNGHIAIANEMMIDRLIKQGRSIAFPVVIGDNIDVGAHRLVEKAITHGYVGIGLLKASEYQGQNPSVSMLILEKRGK